MATVNVAPTTIDVDGLPIGDTLTIRCVFDVDLDGYAAWAAKVGPKSGDKQTFAIDDSEQADRVITVDLTSEQTTLVRTGWRWDMRVVTPNGGVQTIAAGVFTMRKPVTETPEV